MRRRAGFALDHIVAQLQAALQLGEALCRSMSASIAARWGETIESGAHRLPLGRELVAIGPQTRKMRERAGLSTWARMQRVSCSTAIVEAWDTPGRWGGR